MAAAGHHRPTGFDVARMAGVSQSTVSLVFSGKDHGRVSPEAAERVRRSAAHLGYRPHLSASALRAGRTRTVALLVPEVTNPFFGWVLRGAQAAGRADHVTVALIEPGPERDWQLTALESLNSAAVDGVMLYAIDPPSRAGRDLGPTVLIEAVADTIPSVLLDAQAGTHAAVTYLLDLGHRRIAHLGTNLPASTFRRRGEQWRACMQETTGTGDLVELLVGFDLHAARGAAHELLTSTPRPTAIFCDDDLLAAGAMLAAHDLGIAVPSALSIMGFAGTILSEAATPQISTVLAPAEELGALAMRTLTQLINGAPTPASQTLPMSLRPRASTAPPPPD